MSHLLIATEFFPVKYPAMRWKKGATYSYFWILSLSLRGIHLPNTRSYQQATSAPQRPLGIWIWSVKHRSRDHPTGA